MSEPNPTDPPRGGATAPEDPMCAETSRTKHRHLVWLGVFAGCVLTAIGVRFLADPLAAQHTFGLAKGLLARDLHHVIGLRDIWLGGLAILFAVLKEWRALALWLSLGALVCVADAAIVVASTGKWWAIAFHLGSAVFCGWLAVACWRAWKRGPLEADGGPDAADGPSA